jgi:hypothetical protein
MASVPLVAQEKLAEAWSRMSTKKHGLARLDVSLGELTYIKSLVDADRHRRSSVIMLQKRYLEINPTAQTEAFQQ